MSEIAVFAAVGLTAAATRPDATGASLLPTLAAIASAVAVLYLLIPRVRTPARRAEPAIDEPEGSPRRSFLAAGAATAGIAAGAGLAGRLLTERRSVARAQKARRLT